MLSCVFEYCKVFVCPQFVFLQAKAVEASLKTAERELDTFQREKQHKLNELYAVVPLKLHQVIQDFMCLLLLAGAEWPMYI